MSTEGNRNSSITNASFMLCTKSPRLLWLVVLRSTDSQDSVTSLDVNQTLSLSTDGHERVVWCSDLRVYLLFILNYVCVCSRPCISELGFQWIRPWNSTVLYVHHHLACVWFSVFSSVSVITVFSEASSENLIVKIIILILTNRFLLKLNKNPSTVN